MLTIPPRLSAPLRLCASWVSLALICYPASAAENRYDVLSKLLTPFERVLVARPHEPARALVADVLVVEASGLPGGATSGVPLHLALQAPDKLYLTGTVLGRRVTVCRSGQDLWASPGSDIRAILGPANGSASSVSSFDSFALPIPEKQLVFLPALFDVQDAGTGNAGGEACRVLDISLMPQLASAWKLSALTARVWVKPDYKPARLQVVSGAWRVTLAFQKLDFPPALPPSSWQPSPEQSADIIHLSPAQVRQVFDSLK